MPPTTIQLRRIYESAGSDEGLRVLVDRLWPRGIRKEEARVDRWLKEVAPSEELRRWFGHDPAKWGEFRKRYLRELTEHKATLRQVLAEAEGRPMTLLYAARDPEHNQARVLREYLRKLRA